MNRPLLSLILLCYNQEKYIRQTLLHALAQTYSPLEIIVNDDASTDGTWIILQEVAASYHGPHTLRLHRNAGNLGIIRNLEQGCRQAHGELLIKADGDDYNHPLRIEAIAEQWLSAGKTPLVLAHGSVLMDDAGYVIGHKTLPFYGWNTFAPAKIFHGIPLHYQGGACAYSPRLFREFPPVAVPQAVDDLTLTLRALLLQAGDTSKRPVFLHIQGEWTFYRMGSGVTTDYSRYRSTVGRCYSLIYHAYCQFELDLKHCTFLPAASRKEFQRWNSDALRFYGGILELYTSADFKKRWHAFLEMGIRALLSWKLPLYLYLLFFPPARG